MAVAVVFAATGSASAAVTDPSAPGAVPKVAPPTHVFVEGDSIAVTVGLGLVSVGTPEGFTVTGSAWLGCGLEPGGEVIWRPQALGVAPDGCPGWAQHWAQLVAHDRPSVVALLVGDWDMYDRVVDGRWLPFGSPASDRRISGLLDQATSVLSSSGARVALLTMPYESPVEAPVRVAQYRSAFDAARVRHWNALLRAAARRHPNVAHVVDLNRFATPHGYTDTLDGVTPFRGTNSGPGTPVVEDGVHFTPAGADLVARWLLPRLAAIAAPARPGPPR
jgi:SGNH domain (fused to AT3 domains)